MPPLKMAVENIQISQPLGKLEKHLPYNQNLLTILKNRRYLNIILYLREKIIYFCFLSYFSWVVWQHFIFYNFFLSPQFQEFFYISSYFISFLHYFHFQLQVWNLSFKTFYSDILPELITDTRRHFKCHTLKQTFQK